MDFALTEEQEALKLMVHDFMKKECSSEYMQEKEEKEEFPEELWQKMAQTGLLGAPIPEQYGGSGGDIITMAIILEELARVFPDMSFAYIVNICFGSKSLEYFGTDEQKEKYLPLLCEGKLKFAMAMTEPNGGTDVLGALKTRATLEGDHFIVNGTKMFITGAHIADHIMTIVKTNPNAPKKSGGISLLLIDRKSPGVETIPIKKLGFKSVQTCEVVFDNVSVPKENILGEMDKGWYHLLDTLNNERIDVAAQCIGIAQGAFDLALEYAKQREAFGKPIGQYQAIQHYLAIMSTEIELARLMNFKAAWLQSNKKPCGVESTMAKYYASKVAFEVASQGMQILGGYGFAMEYDMQRFFRDSKLLTVAPISNEMALNFIGQNLGLPKSY
ncbi:MAG: hypothetical protein APF81_11300 [Desulfosporosinus sp. BRH_c37]|nr:MAG: hypothetical protein APF81_11300 [Desulfosporosinus sp. BRH_c37]